MTGARHEQNKYIFFIHTRSYYPGVLCPVISNFINWNDFFGDIFIFYLSVTHAGEIKNLQKLSCIFVQCTSKDNKNLYNVLNYCNLQLKLSLLLKIGYSFFKWEKKEFKLVQKTETGSKCESIFKVLAQWFFFHIIFFHSHSPADYWSDSFDEGKY